jgi:diguanylate cyclase (GGDEF)-like protein/PAS domain S-box-containing protein
VIGISRSHEETEERLRKDITEQKRAQEALRESEERYRTVVEATPDGVAIVDFQGIVRFANQQFARMLGYASPAAVLDKAGLEFAVAEDRAIAERELAAIVKRGSVSNVRIRQRRVDGSIFTSLMSGGIMRDEHGEPAGIVAIMRDISDQVAYEDQLRHLALHDPLTGIPNRTLLMDRLDHALAGTERAPRSLVLLLMDLDSFKEINDTYGHQTGDLALREVSRRLGASLRQSDTLARLGGDEFAIMLPDVDLGASLQTVSRLASILEQPIDLGGLRFQMGASIGVVLAPDHGKTAEELLRRADVAMYTAKRTNSRYAVYSPDQDSSSPMRLVALGELRDAIESHQLVLHFQPKLNLNSGRIERAEALVRWQHPTHGLIPPDQFIGMAEHSGLIRPLTAWVVRQALAQCRRWRTAGFDLGVTVNLSARSLHDPELPAVLAESLRRHAVPAGHLTVEVTESTIMAEPARAMDVLRRAKELGISIAIDDFGVGYSSIRYLRELGAHQLKIDRSFVFELARHDPDTSIVRAVIELGHNLGLEVAAEGVESQTVLDMLRGLHCDWAQGYHVGRPQPGEELTSQLQSHGDDRC